MALPAILETLFQREAHGLAQAKDQRDWRCVMVEAIFAPIVHRGGEVKVPALYFCLAIAKNFFGFGADGNGRHARRRTDGFLRAAEADVHALVVDMERDGGEGGD